MKEQDQNKELKDCSKSKLVNLVKKQHDHIKRVEADNEYLNGINKANNLHIAGAMIELDLKVLRIPFAARESAINDYVLHWDRDEKTKDLLFHLENRKIYEKREGDHGGTDQDNTTKDAPVD
jgi:hypothetical protein